MLMRQNVNKDVILKSAYWEWIECILDLPLLKVALLGIALPFRLHLSYRFVCHFCLQYNFQIESCTSSEETLCRTHKLLYLVAIFDNIFQLIINFYEQYFCAFV